MPLFTVTMKYSRSADEKDRLSQAIHAASIVAGYPEDDLFQRFLSLEPSDLRVDPYYPALPKPRTDLFATSKNVFSWCARSVVALIVGVFGRRINRDFVICPKPKDKARVALSRSR